MRKRAAHSCQLAAAAVAIVALTAGVASAATPPTATTGTASQISYQSAALDGGANPEGTATEVYFEYGTSKAYGSTSAPIPLAAGKATEAVTATVTGLAAFTKYDYRLVATNATGTTDGGNQTFTTSAASSSGSAFTPVGGLIQGSSRTPSSISRHWRSTSSTSAGGATASAPLRST